MLICECIRRTGRSHSEGKLVVHVLRNSSSTKTNDGVNNKEFLGMQRRIEDFSPSSL
jgi:hypothetical protein